MLVEQVGRGLFEFSWGSMGGLSVEGQLGISLGSLVA
jgi:hypothetical protein